MNRNRCMRVRGISSLSKLGICLALFLPPGSASFGIQTRRSSDRPFTVRDSIEMTTFSDPFVRSPEAECKVSPDGKSFFVITTKGNLLNNRLHSALWLYSTDQVNAFLHGTRTFAPKPHLLWQDAAIPKAQQLDSYGSLITKAQWTSDSQHISFLAETGDGVRRLYSLNIRSARILRLSTPRAEVEDFTQSAGTTAFVVRANIDEAVDENPSFLHTTNVSTVLTGRTLFNIFDPHHFPRDGSIFPSGNLWALFQGRQIRLDQTTEFGAWHYPAAAMSLFHLALAPDGQRLIAAKPISQIEDSWSRFTSRSQEFSFANLPRTEAREDRDWRWPWEYMYVDLKHDLTTPIVNAPVAWIDGYKDAVLAAWSPDGSEVLLSNTFLPISKSGTKQQTVPCAAAVFTVATRNIQCVAYTREPQMSLTRASFENGSNQIELSWTARGRAVEEIYRSEFGHWTLAGMPTTTSVKSDAVTVSIHQDLNQPPALWATHARRGVSKVLWNPNPHLASLVLGHASVFHWRDASGYEWTAGLLKPYAYMPGHRYPLVIQTHGFDPHEFLVDGSYTTGFAAQALASAGIMVLQMEDQGDRHLKPVSEEATSFAIGCAAAIQQLTIDGLIDPAEVGIIGFSRTSWYVETALEKYPKLFKAATIIDGVDQGYTSDILFCPGLPSCKSDHQAANGGPPFGKYLNHWLMAAPSFNLNKIQAPLRIEAIRWYSILEEWEIYSSLYQQGKPVDFIYIPDGQHILQQPQQRFVSEQGNVDWFRFWLQGYESPNPEGKAEYQRWEQLREAATTNTIGPTRSGNESGQGAD